jgi:hypothetical protein
MRVVSIPRQYAHLPYAHFFMLFFFFGPPPTLRVGGKVRPQCGPLTIGLFYAHIYHLHIVNDNNYAHFSRAM